MTAWRSNEAVTPNGSGALRTNPDGMRLDNENIHDLPGTVNIIHKDEELPMGTTARSKAPGDGTTMMSVDGGMKVEGDANDASREPFNRNVDDASNAE